MLKRTAAIAITVCLGLTTTAIARPEVGPTKPTKQEVAVAIIKHKIDEKTPDRPDLGAEKMGPSFCVTKVLDHAAAGFEACKTDWSFSCVSSSFEMMTGALEVCSSGVRD